MKITLTPKTNKTTIADVPVQTVFSGYIGGQFNMWIKAQRYMEEAFVMPLTGSCNNTWSGASEGEIVEYMAYTIGYSPSWLV